MGNVVVTYWTAPYGEGVELCQACADGPAAPRFEAGIGVLGPVQYGAHEGVCALCSTDEEEED